MFVRPGIPELMRDQVVPAADIVTPNHFELDFLTGTSSRTLAELLDAVDELRSAGPSVVLVTSVLVDDTPDDSLDLVAVSGEGAWRTRTPRLDVVPAGAGDLTAAVFLANLLDGRQLDEALARTTSSVFAVIEATTAAGELRAADRRRPGPARRAPHGVRPRTPPLDVDPGVVVARPGTCGCPAQLRTPVRSTRAW